MHGQDQIQRQLFTEKVKNSKFAEGWEDGRWGERNEGKGKKGEGKEGEGRGVEERREGQKEGKN